MTRIHSIYRITLLIALVLTIAGTIHFGHHAASPGMSHAQLANLAGGSSNPTGCALGYATLGLVLLGGAVFVAATGGAGAPILAIAGAYAPLGAVTC